MDITFPDPIKLRIEDIPNLTEEQAMGVFRATRRMCALHLISQETHEHNLDDCGDYLTAATVNWATLQQALWADDFQDLIPEVKLFLQDFVDDRDDAKYPREACDGDVRYDILIDLPED